MSIYEICEKYTVLSSDLRMMNQYAGYLVILDRVTGKVGKAITTLKTLGEYRVKF